MSIVGIDTSMAHTAVCVLRDDGEAFATPAPQLERLAETPQHSQELLPMLVEQLQRAGLGWGEVESIAVGTGPGTFTGLRIGIATARGLAQALTLALRPVSSLATLAAGMSAEVEAGARLCPLIDARRGEVFAALFDASTRPPDALWGPEAVSPARLVEQLKETDRPILAAGDWALKSIEVIEKGGAALVQDPALNAVDALHTCLIGRDVEPVQPVNVVPSYVRLPDAEINRRVVEGGG